jgi:hypothetical protein
VPFGNHVKNHLPQTPKRGSKSQKDFKTNHRNIAYEKTNYRWNGHLSEFDLMRHHLQNVRNEKQLRVHYGQSQKR